MSQKEPSPNFCQCCDTALTFANRVAHSDGHRFYCRPCWAGWTVGDGTCQHCNPPPDDDDKVDTPPSDDDIPAANDDNDDKTPPSDDDETPN